jgi:hypothetical protein
VSRHVQAVSAQLARLNVAQDKPVQVGVRYPAAGIIATGDYYPFVTPDYMYNLSFTVPPSEGIYRRELVLLSLRMSNCSRLPASNEDVRWQVQVDRAGATRRMTTAEIVDERSPGAGGSQS